MPIHVYACVIMHMYMYIELHATAFFCGTHRGNYRSMYIHCICINHVHVHNRFLDSMHECIGMFIRCRFSLVVLQCIQ